MKTLKVVLLCTILTMLFAGCARRQELGTPENPYIIRLGHHHNVGSIVDRLAFEFQRLVHERSNGRIRVNVFPGAQLGQENEAAEGVLLGVQQMTIVTPTMFMDAVEGFGLDSLPFLFSDWDDQWNVFNNSEIGRILDANMVARGARILGWFTQGGRNMIFVSRNVTRIDQIRGLRMRSPESPIYIAMFNALGASPTPITWGEAYTAMQTGVVDGMEAPIAALTDMNFGEVASYVLMTDHIWGAFALLINENFFQTFPPDLQQLILECGADAVRYAQNASIESQEAVKQEWTRRGLVFHDLSPEDRVLLGDLMRPITDQWATGGPGRRELLDTLQEMRRR